MQKLIKELDEYIVGLSENYKSIYEEDHSGLNDYSSILPKLKKELDDLSNNDE